MLREGLSDDIQAENGIYVNYIVVWGKEEVGGTVCAEALSVVLASTCIHVLNRKGDPSEAVQPLGPSLDKRMPELPFSLAPSARGFLFSGQTAQT